jgi:protein-S-isoprenylcysteine O-methyltransferase Ste14
MRRIGNYLRVSLFLCSCLGCRSFVPARGCRRAARRVETFGDSYRPYMERTGKIFPSIR